MKVWIVSSSVLAAAALATAGCEGEIGPSPSDTETSTSALTCGSARHGEHDHDGHHHGRHHHHHGGGGAGGTVDHGGGGTTGAAGTTGTAGTMGMAGTTGAGGGGGSGPDCTAPDGMISWWHADGDYDDAVGTNDGNTAGAVSFGPGEQLQGFVLSGSTNSFVEVPDSTSLEVSGPFTVDAWINFSGADGRIIDKITAFATDGYLLDTFGGGLRFLVAGDAVGSPAGLPTGTFTHVAGVYDGSSLTVYVNGALSATKPTGVSATPVNNRNFRIGADSSGGSLFNGTIDEPRIFGRALSAAEIKTLFDQGSVCP